MSALMTHLAVRRGRQLIAPFMWLVHCSRFFSARLFSAIIPHLPAAAADSRKPSSTTNYIPRVCFWSDVLSQVLLAVVKIVYLVDKSDCIELIRSNTQ